MSYPEPSFVPLNFRSIPEAEQRERADEFFELLKRRRTVREYSDREVPFELIEKAVLTAGTAPSGANMQPWRFVVVRDLEVKKKIREAAEKEEYESYYATLHPLNRLKFPPQKITVWKARAEPLSRAAERAPRRGSTGCAPLRRP